MTTASEARALRQHHKPDKIRLLFVGESPPNGPNFFYKARGPLFEATREAFLRAVPELCRGPFLEDFKRLACYLEDLSQHPINQLPSAERAEARRRSEDGLARRLRSLSPRAIVIVMDAVVPNIARAIDRAGLAKVERHELVFPLYQHRALYINGLSALLPILLPKRRSSRHRN
jgi:hypothetical protein